MRWLRYILSLGRLGGTEPTVAPIPTPHFIWTFDSRNRTWNIPERNRTWNVPSRRT